MCKNFFKGLLGGGAIEAAPPPAAPAPTPVADAVEAPVKNPDVVDALSSGREATGRVRLGTSKRTAGTVAGLSI